MSCCILGTGPGEPVGPCQRQGRRCSGGLSLGGRPPTFKLKACVEVIFVVLLLIACHSADSHGSGSPLGACRCAWGWRDDQKDQKFNLSIGIGFSLLGCLILLLTYLKLILTSLMLSIISFYLFYIFEKSTEDFKKKDIDYKKFRKILILISLLF